MSLPERPIGDIVGPAKLRATIVTLPPTRTSGPAPARVVFHVAIGGALGLCVGILMGMTTAPVVGTVIGALAALFAAIFGVKDEDLSSFGRSATGRLTHSASAIPAVVLPQPGGPIRTNRCSACL